MALVETEAVVLRTYNLAEADKIVVCLSRAAGVIRGVARGCRRLKSRFGAALEPFTLLNLTYYQKEHQELVYLGQTEIIRSSFDLSSEPNVLAGLAYMGDLIIEFSPPYQANEKLFRMLKACLESISEAPGDLQPILRYFEIWLLRLEGFFPDIRHCGECSRELSEAENILIGPDLTISCASCKHPLARALPKGLNAQLRATQKLSPRAFAQGARTVSAVTLGEMKKLTQQIIARVLEREPRTPVFLG